MDIKAIVVSGCLAPAMFNGCASQNYVRIKTDQDADIIVADQAVAKIKKFEEQQIATDGPIYLKSEGFNPVIIIPSDAATKDLKINFQSSPVDAKSNAAAATSSQTQVSATENLDKLIESVLEIQRKIGEKQFDTALTILDDLQRTYPKVSNLKLTRASIYYLSGKNSEALASLDSFLADHPDHKEAIALKTRLTEGQK